jgi:autoinducer 2-degrading protein
MQANLSIRRDHLPPYLSIPMMKLTPIVSILLWAIHFSALSAFTPSRPFVQTVIAPKSRARMAASSSSESPFCIVVEAEIEPDRMGEFLAMIQANAEGSRKEPECLRFDVIRSQDAQNKFFFYEIYKNPDSINHHKAQSHYKAWIDFKESGGVLKSVTHKGDGEFMT